MREKRQAQMPLAPQIKNHWQFKASKTISSIIDINPTICGWVLQDLNRADP